MFRMYIACAILALGSFGYSQYRGWSVFGSDVEEFQKRRAEQAATRTWGGGSRGGSSGHK